VLDELCERAVDRAVQAYEQWSVPWKTRYRRSAAGFRLTLIAQSIQRFAGQLFNKIAAAAGDDGFLQRLIQEPVEPVDNVKFSVYLRAQLARADGFFRGRAFPYLLLMTMLSVCLLAAKGTRELAVLCAFFCLQWLAEAMDGEYAPVSAQVRQKFLAALLLRASSYLALLISYFSAYARDGLAINILLQGSMLLTIAVHLILFMSFAAFNRRQQLFLRLIYGVLGFAPALSCAAGAALCASTMARGAIIAAGGILRAAGMLLAFLSQQAEMIDSIGGGLSYPHLTKGITMMTGFFMMLCGAWLCAL